MTRPAPRSSALVGLGERLRDLRHARRLSLNDLAEASGVPPSTISKIENQQLNPSLVHAINLAKALDENLGFLIDAGKPADADFSIVRSDHRARLDLPEMSLSLEDMQGDFARGTLEARIGTIGSGATSGEELMRHDGEELCYVLSGKLRYWIGDQAFDLNVGDSIHFKCEDAHSWENIHDTQTKVIWVFSEKLSF